MIADFFVIIYWWLLFFAFSFFISPFIFFIFSKFWDKGWIFSKSLSLAIVSYLVFLSGRVHLFPFQRSTIFASLFLILISSSLFLHFGKKKQEFLRQIKKNYKRIIFTEVMFFILLTLWAFLRGFEPRIEGLEKFMDQGFVNSILQSRWFPPQDIWFAGESINYYYFGHFQAAVLTKFSGLDSAVTYNLMIASIFALAFSSTFSLSSNLILSFKTDGFKKKIKGLKTIIVAGLISAFLLSLGGNLHSSIFALKDGAKNYWYPDSTRFIGYNPDNPKDKTIHEFPLYSFVVSDLHGHVNDIPQVLLFLSLLFVFGLTLTESAKKQKKKLFCFSILLGFVLGVEYMTNSWDFPIYGVLFAIFLFLLLTLKNGFWGKKILLLIKKEFTLGFVVLFSSILFFLPFALEFKPMTKGVDFVLARSLFWQLGVLWGFFWFLCLSFLAILVCKRKQKRALAVSDVFVLSACLWATVLIIIPEVIYVKDIYIIEHHRSNTMFKLVYQSFMLYSLSAGYIFLRVKEQLKRKLVIFAFLACFSVGFTAQMVYPFFAIRGYYGNLNPKNYEGLYGLKFLEKAYKDDYEAVSWIKKNTSGQPVLLEAAGDSYTLYNRISALTGLPTIQGWFVHEWLWRGGYEGPSLRASEVDQIYQGESDKNAKFLLQKYNVEYVFLGELEKEKYEQIKEKRFEDFGNVVFSSGETKLYKLNFN
ncbi:MAG: DUF2298 domain-containing protein [Patescibacteria group bacterium]